MYPAVATKDPHAVQAEVQSTYARIFPAGNSSFVPRAFGWAMECFSGRYRDYQAIDAQYHDFEHTLQGTLCMSRILLGRHLAGVEPRLTEKMFELGILAILLHDTGYLKKADDTEGTGAKYTVVHVGRSADFAAQLLAEKGFASNEIKSVQNMIHCTGVDAAVSTIPFQSELEKTVGFGLGTADLVGQMAAADYVDKLPILYSEFAEAASFMHDNKHFIASFTSASDLMRRTPAFWEKFVVNKLDKDFGGLHRFLNDPYPSGPNEYLDRIEANIERLKKKLSAETVMEPV
jgi:hypothetical protein